MLWAKTIPCDYLVTKYVCISFSIFEHFPGKADLDHICYFSSPSFCCIKFYPMNDLFRHYFERSLQPCQEWKRYLPLSRKTWSMSISSQHWAHLSQNRNQEDVPVDSLDQKSSMTLKHVCKNSFLLLVISKDLRNTGDSSDSPDIFSMFSEFFFWT